MFSFSATNLEFNVVCKVNHVTAHSDFPQVVGPNLHPPGSSPTHVGCAVFEAFLEELLEVFSQRFSTWLAEAACDWLAAALARLLP